MCYIIYAHLPTLNSARNSKFITRAKLNNLWGAKSKSNSLNIKILTARAHHVWVGKAAKLDLIAISTRKDETFHVAQVEETNFHRRFFISQSLNISLFFSHKFVDHKRTFTRFALTDFPSSSQVVAYLRTSSLAERSRTAMNLLGEKTKRKAVVKRWKMSYFRFS